MKTAYLTTKERKMEILPEDQGYKILAIDSVFEAAKQPRGKKVGWTP